MQIVVSILKAIISPEQNDTNIYNIDDVNEKESISSEKSEEETIDINIDLSIGSGLNNFESGNIISLQNQESVQLNIMEFENSSSISLSSLSSSSSSSTS